MPSPEPSHGFKRLQRATLFGARAGLTGGFAVLSADVAGTLVPRQHVWWTYGIVGGTMAMLLWWAWGRLFKKSGFVVE